LVKKRLQAWHKSYSLEHLQNCNHHVLLILCD
jgi:hypothetical protein